jgi:hypothetical protein
MKKDKKVTEKDLQKIQSSISGLKDDIKSLKKILLSIQMQKEDSKDKEKLENIEQQIDDI